MSAFTILLYGFELLAGLAAIGILFVKNVFHAALLLIVCLLALAGVFILHSAEFIAVTQILVYAGGILVLIIFGIMLTSRTAGKKPEVKNQYVFVASFICVFLASVLIKLFTEQDFYHSGSLSNSSFANPIRQTGISLMSDYALALETAGILLLIALVAAAVTASSFNSKKP